VDRIYSATIPESPVANKASLSILDLLIAKYHEFCNTKKAISLRTSEGIHIYSRWI